ncbi:MAG: glycosyltransferase family 1 protein [Candidatus Wolfebacteria bacterium]|nr:glycosyltransferase family 1 protein [Candidatus Wolfebacteria bacterium]
MKIAFTSGNLIRDMDGVAQVIYKMIDILKRKRIEIIGLSQLIPAKKDQEIPMVKVPSFSLPFYKQYRVPFHVKNLLKKTLDKFSPDIIHVHSPDTLGFAAAEYGREHNIPVIATHHTRFTAYLKYYHLQILEGVLWKLLQELYEKCELVLCPSSQIVEELNRHGIKNTLFLPHGVDTTFFNPKKRSEKFRKEHGLDQKTALLFVGRLVWSKDLNILAGAYKHLKRRSDIAFVLAGEGPAREGLEKQMPEAIFLGHLPAKKVAEAYASCDVFVFPSTTETFGLVTLEAMASGIPAVAAEASGTSDIVQNGKTGLLTKPKNVKDFTEKIEEIVTNKTLQKKMGRAALQYARTQTWEKIVEKVIQKYNKLAPSA